MFGSTQASNNQGGTSLFGNSGTTNQGGIFGTGAQPNNTQTQPQTGSLFGQVQNQNQPQQQTGGLFGSSILGNNQQNQQSANFGTGQNTQQNPPQLGTGLFGQSQTNQQQPTGIFNNSSTAQRPLFQNSTQQPGSIQPQLGQLSTSSLWQPGSGLTPRKLPTQFATSKLIFDR